MPRVNFSSLFDVLTDDSIRIKQRLRINGITISPGAVFAKGVPIAGVDFENYRNNDFEVITDGDTLVIKAVYKAQENA